MMDHRGTLSISPESKAAQVLAIQDYFAVPNHTLACTDLDYRRFSDSTPLTIVAATLHIHHILLAFSRTDAGRYAKVWMSRAGAKE